MPPVMDPLPKGVDLRRLRYFAAVADELHFGRAAEILGIAQPPLSQQIKALEEAIGAQLFIRDSRTVALTAAGEVLRGRIGTIVDEVRNALDETVATSQGQLGTVRLGFVSSAAAMVAAAIPRFTAAHPRVSVNLSEGFTDHTVAALIGGSLDAAIVRDSAPLQGVVVHPLLQEEFVAIVPSGHVLTGKSHLSAHDLRGEPLVLYPREASPFAWERNVLPLTEIGELPRVVQAASNWVTIMHLVSAGTGITLAPKSVTDALVPGVRVIPLTGTSARSHIDLLHNADTARPATQRLVDVIIQWASDDSPQD